MSLKRLLRRWPVVRQFLEGGDGTGPEAMTERTSSLQARTDNARTFRSVCPYCGVGCGQLVRVRDGRVTAIEGDPDSPISQGTLCPKGAASHELVTNPHRETRVKYRAPFAREWQDLPLDEAMELLARRVWESRNRTWEDAPLRRSRGVAHLGGATLDIEENYLIKKLFTGGLGLVALSNQARI